MHSSSTRPTCLSSEEHDDNISNHLLHYLGCIEVSQRKDFFATSNPIWEKDIERQLQRLKSLKKAVHKHEEDQIRENVRDKRDKWKKECERDLRRFTLIRRCLETSEEEPRYVEAVTESLAMWRASEQFKKGIKMVEGWSKRAEHDEPTLLTSHIEEAYDPDKDLNVHIIRYKDRGRRIETPRGERRGSEVDSISPGDNWKEKMKSETMKVHTVISKPEDGTGNKLNGLRKGDEGVTISYVHFPANNMQAVARYYDQEAPDYQGVLDDVQGHKTETDMILRPQYWRSQMHGSTNSMPHARHMRPICESISSNPDVVSSNPKNLVLFMPYLHWEKDRCRHKFAEAMETIRNSWENEQHNEEISKKRERQQSRAQLHPEKSQSLRTHTSSSNIGADGLPGVVEKVTKRANQTKESTKKPGRFILPYRCSALGQLLLDVAALYEAMSNYRDKQLLGKYLYSNPPIHPRRTLDQAYYWTLNTTKHRDRDQVVYRATNARAQDFRHFKKTTQEWVDHTKIQKLDPCKSCTKAIKKVSRAVMVDQLWMWILEEKTIITCFPKRYGTQKHDRSGVHKAIRSRLENARPNQIKSVFDLALIILDECSNTFFDRTKTADRQPKVIDQFSEAIGNIARKETTSFEQLVHWTKQARSFYRQPRHNSASELHVPLLDINPEANMHREIKDIAEELDIMINVVRSHMTVLEDFITHVQHMLDPDGLFGYRYSVGGERRVGSPRAYAHAEPMSPGGSTSNKQTYKFFMMNAEEMRIKMSSRITELEHLRQSAQSACDSVKNLLDMKQQQAGVVQAWMALNQTEESVKQGRSIMLFTVLPLTFTAGIFGMNAVEFGANGSLKIAHEFAVMYADHSLGFVEEVRAAARQNANLPTLVENGRKSEQSRRKSRSKDTRDK
ncbi:hypothetical protein FDECE_733 [Fusarium decemcellulare]|nr:hypothetical protein FDECE_733 [Fusarium decemcellulare]